MFGFFATRNHLISLLYDLSHNLMQINAFLGLIITSRYHKLIKWKTGFKFIKLALNDNTNLLLKLFHCVVLNINYYKV